MNYKTAAAPLGGEIAVNQAIEAAKHLITKGYTITSLAPKGKNPVISGWNDKVIGQHELDQYFVVGSNLGIILGNPSGGIVDIDFDNWLAKQFAHFLPPTDMIHGRPNNPLSHYWYKVQGGIKSKKLTGTDNQCLLEIRSTGGATMVPPSIHPDGDQLAWVCEGDPALVDGAVLHAAVGKIASGALLSMHWPQKGCRNDCALALAGTLLRGGWSQEETSTFIYQVAKFGGDEEYTTRANCVPATAAKLEAGEPVTGIPALTNLLGNEVVKKVVQWLELKQAGSETEEVVERLNQEYAVVSVDRSTYIMRNILDPMTGWHDIRLMNLSDFRMLMMNKVIEGESSKSQAISEIWLKHPLRREYDGIEFSPGQSHLGYFNLFQGFPIKPSTGNCALYLGHLQENICNGDLVLYEYVIRWMAHAIQHPSKLPGTALVLRGLQGTGKGVFVEGFGKLFGAHFLTVTSMNQVTGRFNSHLKHILLLHANEAVWGGNKEAEGALKAMITDPTAAIESKGVDIIQLNNYKRLIIASNESWAAPVGFDDRRFLFLNVSPKRKEDHAYFAAIIKQMENGGYAALMNHLFTIDISGFEVKKLPMTPNSFDAKLRSGSPLQQWWFEQLYSGADFLKDNPIKEEVYKLYLEWCKDQKKYHPGSLSIFCRELKEMVPDLKSKKVTKELGHGYYSPGRKNCFIFPPLATCKKNFEAYSKSPPTIWSMF